MDDNQSKDIVPKKPRNTSPRNTYLVKRGLQAAQEIITTDSSIRQKLEEIPKFYSVPHNLPGGVASVEDFKSGKIQVLFIGGVDAQRYIAFINSNASAILFSLDDPIESLGAQAAWSSVQKAYEKYNIGNQLDDIGKYDEAEKLYWESLKIYPNPECYANLARIYLVKNKYRDVELICNRGIKTTKVIVTTGIPYTNEFHVFAIIYSNLGLALHNLGRLEEAETVLQKSIAISPNYANSYHNLGTLLVSQNRFREAESSYRRAIVTDPNHAESYFELGILLANQNRYEEAEDAWRNAIDIDPDYAQAHCELGSLLADQDHLQEAEDAYRRAIAADPNFF